MDILWIIAIFASTGFGVMVILALVFVVYKYHKKTRRKDFLNPACSIRDNIRNNAHSTKHQEKIQVYESIFHTYMIPCKFFLNQNAIA